MLKVQVDLNTPARAYAPGETVSGTAQWDGTASEPEVEIRLFWYTEGAGDTDISLIDRLVVEGAQSSGQCEFMFTLPEGPYSFSGRLVSVLWAIELVIQPGNAVARQVITVSPSKTEVTPASIGSIWHAGV